jgi:CHRD domain
MKINTIFLLTVVGVFATFSLFTISTTTNFNAVAQSNETAVAQSNETAVAQSNETAVAQSNETAVAPSNETAVAPSNTTDNNPDFNANLTAPAISSNSDATGNATFTLKDGGNTMYYEVSGNGLANITQVVVLQSTGGRTTDLVSLYYAPTSGLFTKGSGTADGNFTSADFVNILEGKPMSDLVKKILDGEAFIAIKSVPFPLGEIAGKIQPVE